MSLFKSDRPVADTVIVSCSKHHIDKGVWIRPSEDSVVLFHEQG